MATYPLDRSRTVDVALWSLAVACAAGTFWFSFGSEPEAAHAFNGADKMLHAAAYAVTMFFVLLAAVWRPGRGPGPLASFAGVLVAGPVLFGGAIELLQGLAGRDADVGDWFADIAGVVVALSLHSLLRGTLSEPLNGRR